MKRITLLLWLVLLPSPLYAAATIITDPNDVATRFEAPSSTHITPNRNKATDPKNDLARQEGCDAATEGRTRYNGAAGVKTIEFCDGETWVGLIKTAGAVDAAAPEKCAQQQEALVRYNKSKAIKAYEYCDGTQWQKMGKGSLPLTSAIFDKPFVHNEKTPGLLTSGVFHEDGYIGGYIACNGGINHLSLHLTIGNDKTAGANNDKVVSATAQNNSPGRIDIDHASFFSYVPKNMPWKIWVRENIGGGQINKANCAVKVTRFGN